MSEREKQARVVVYHSKQQAGGGEGKPKFVVYYMCVFLNILIGVSQLDAEQKRVAG